MKKIVAAVFVIVFVSVAVSQTVDTHKGEVPYTISSNQHLVVKAHINDSAGEYNFIVDTGAMTVIDTSVVEALGLKKRGMMAKMNSMDMSGFRIENIFCMTTFPLRMISEPELPIHGIIGSNLLERFTVVFDFPNKKLVFSADTLSRALPENSITLPFEKHPINNAPIVSFSAGEKVMKGMIDTGQPYPVVFPLKDFETMNNSCVKDAIQSRGIIVKWPYTKPSHNYLARITSFTLGEMTVNNMICAFGTIPAMLSMPLIGNEFLSQFTMVLNYPKSEIALIPADPLDFKSNRAGYGLKPDLKDDGTIEIEGVWIGSPADKAGLDAGDTITGFNGTPASAETYHSLLRQLYFESAEEIRIDAAGSKGKRSVLLHKEDLLKPEA